MIQHKADYSLLAIIGTIYTATVFRFQTTPYYLVLATAGFSLLYVLWGIYHQSRVKNFHPRIVLEYLLVALLGVAIVSTLLL